MPRSSTPESPQTPELFQINLKRKLRKRRNSLTPEKQDEQISRRKIQTLISNSDIKALASFVDDIERIVNIMTKERFIHLACHT